MLSAARAAYVVGHLDKMGFDATALPDAERAWVFDLLARTEELATSTRHNAHNWEPAFADLDRRDEAHRPVLEERAAAWAEAGLLQARAGAAAGRWPEGKRFALCLTHDIDIVLDYPWLERWRAIRAMGWRRHDKRALFAMSMAKQWAKRMAAVGRGASTPPLETWMEEEGKHGFKSSYLFMADPKAAPTWEDGYYRYGDRIDFEGKRRTVGEAMRLIAERGWDVGLHASCEAHVSAELLAAEKAAVEVASGVPCTSVRQHHLMFDIRSTPRAQADAGLTADSTVGSNTETVFRCGTGLPFPMWDVEADEALPILQIPLVVQDIALMEAMAGDVDLAVGRCVELMERVARVGGALTLLWHNHFRPGSPEHRCYAAVLEEAAARGAWGCSMRDLEARWRGGGGA